MTTELSPPQLTDPKLIKSRWDAMKDALLNHRSVPRNKYPEDHWINVYNSPRLRYHEYFNSLEIRYHGVRIATTWKIIDELLELEPTDLKNRIKSIFSTQDKRSGIGCFIRAVKNGDVRRTEDGLTN